MKKVKVFVSGVISGDPEYKKKFEEATEKLEKMGFAVMNPAILPGEGFAWADYMKVTLAMQRVCDCSFFLPDWRKSKGAKEEHTQAQILFQPCFYTFKEIKKALQENTILN